MNTLKKSLWILGFFLLKLSLVDCQPLPQEPECDDVTVICSLDELNGYGWTTMFADDSNNSPSPLCQNNGDEGGFPHNMSWFGFIAGATAFDITITTMDCTEEGFFGFNQGMQFGVYDDCNYTNSPFCEYDNCGDESGTYSFSVSGLNIGDDYFIFLDGCGGSVCEYTVSIDNGGQFNELDEIGDIECETLPCDEICEGAEGLFFSPLDLSGSPYDLSITYEWSITPSLPGFSGPQIVDDGDLQIEIDFPIAGSYTLCVFGDNTCDVTDEVCTTLVVSAIPDEVFAPMDVCDNEFPAIVEPAGQDPNGDVGLAYGDSGWTGGDITAPGVTTVVAENGFGCEWDQSINITELIVPPVHLIDTFFCIGAGAGVLVGGEYFDEDEEDYEILIENYQGCDSNIILNAYLLEIDFLIQEGTCNPDGSIDIVLDDYEVLPEDFFNFGGLLSWYWTKNGTEIPGTNDLTTINIPAGENGSYSIFFNMDIDGVNCNNAAFVIADGIFIDFDNIQPQADLALPLDPLVCPENIANLEFKLDINGYDTNPLDYTVMWNFPPDAVLVAGDPASPYIQLDFTNATTQEVCYQVTNTCGVKDECITIIFAPSAPPELDLQGEACPDGTFTVTANGIFGTLTDLDTIIWDFNGGNLVTGDTSLITAGPLEISWPGNTSTQTVTATVSYVEECLSYNDTQTINFIIDPPNPVLSCNSNQESMTFNWDAVDGAMEYIVTDMTTGTTQTVTTTSIPLTGLAENVCNTYTIEAIAGPDTLYCQQLVSTAFECCTRECPLMTAELVSPYSGPICIGLNETIENFTVNLVGPDPGNATHNYSGPGITDPVLGTFSPTSAGVGTHTIEYYYEFQDQDIFGCVIPADPITIVVAELPTFTLATDLMTVCVGDEVLIQIGGTYDTALATNLMTDGATIIDDSDPQNIIVSWDTEGEKTVSTMIMTNGCGPLDQNLIVIVEDLPMLDLQCDLSTTTTSILGFTWSTDPRYDDYAVTFPDGSVQNTNIGEITIDNLDPEESVTISVTGNSGNSCDNVMETITCITHPCPQTTLVSNFNGIENICIDGNEMPITITGMAADPTLLSGTETIEISSNGAPLAGGVFDPTAEGPGSYLIELLLLDDNCSLPASFTIEVEDVPTLEVAASTKICITDLWTLEYTGEQNQDFTYSWSIDDGTTFVGSENQSAGFDLPGNYTLTVNAETQNCAATEFSAMVEVIDSLTTPQLECQTSVGEIMVSWIDGNDECDQTYSISINGTIVDNITDVQYEVDNLMPDTPVTITVINESIDCVCENKENTIICRTLECPTLSLSISDDERLICYEGTTNLPMEVFDAISTDDISDYTITYSSDAPISGNTIDPNLLSPGLYTITATAVSGFCDASTTATLEIVAVPNLAFDYDQEICVEDDLQVNYVGDALGVFTFEWTSDSQIGFGDQESPLMMFDAPGDYEYIFTTMSDECPGGSTAILNVTVLDSLRTPTVNCNASLDEIQLSIDVEETNCDGELTVLIDGEPYTGDLSSGTISIDELDANTDFDITVLNTSQCGCDDKSIQLNCSTLPCPDFNFESECETSLDAVTLNWSFTEPACEGVTTVTVDGETYAGDVSGGTITIEDLLASTDVDFVINYTSECGCAFQEIVTCTTDPCPDLNLELLGAPTYYCKDSGDPIILILQADGTTIDNSLILWQGTGISPDGQITANSASALFGSETYSATYVTAGCIYEETIVMEYVDPIALEVTLEEPCPGGTSAILNILNDPEPNVQYFLDGQIITELTNLSITPGQHEIEALVNDKCMSNETVQFNSQDSIAIEMEGTFESFAGEEHLFALNGNYPFQSVIWTVDGEEYIGESVLISYNNATEICVTAWVSDECSIIECMPLIIIQEEVFVPNIFNPDANEPNNSLWVQSNAEIKSLTSLSVYDRWGNRIFHVEDADPNDPSSKWFGTLNGNPVEQGVYIYAGEIEFLSGEIRQFVGDITIVR